MRDYATVVRSTLARVLQHADAMPLTCTVCGPDRTCLECALVPQGDLRPALREIVAVAETLMGQLQHLVAESEALVRRARRFPILAALCGGPAAIPWDMLSPHDAQALQNHGQSLEHLAERGGLDAAEAVAILEDRPVRHPPPDAVSSRDRLVQLIQQHDQVVNPQRAAPVIDAARAVLHYAESTGQCPVCDEDTAACDKDPADCLGALLRFSIAAFDAGDPSCVP